MQDGFYDISAGCLPCNCNQGGSTSQICDQNSANAQCPCIPNVESTTCRMPAEGYYSKALDEIIFEAEEATLAGVCWMCRHYTIRICNYCSIIYSQDM